MKVIPWQRAAELDSSASGWTRPEGNNERVSPFVPDSGGRDEVLAEKGAC